MGAAVLYVLWYTRLFVSDTLETIWGFVLYLVAFFYFLALGPIRDWVASHLIREGKPEG